MIFDEATQEELSYSRFFSGDMSCYDRAMVLRHAVQQLEKAVHERGSGINADYEAGFRRGVADRRNMMETALFGLDEINQEIADTRNIIKSYQVDRAFHAGRSLTFALQKPWSDEDLALIGKALEVAKTQYTKTTIICGLQCGRHIEPVLLLCRRVIDAHENAVREQIQRS